MKLMKILFSIFLINSEVLSANILAYFQDPSYSHELTFHKILKALAGRGHHLTIFGAYTFDYGGNPNVTQHVFKDAVQKFKNNFNVSFGEQKKMHWMQIILNYESNAFYEKACDDMEHPEIQKIIKNVDGKYKFDLIIMECAYCQLALLAELYDCPIVQLAASEAPVAVHEFFGNDVNPAIYSDSTRFPYLHGKLTFIERVSSVFYYFTMQKFISGITYMQYMNKLTKSHPINGTSRSALEVHGERLSLLVINTSPEFGHIRPISPFTVQVGFFHVEKPKELTNFEIKNYLDASTNGVIVVSFGSKIKTADLGLENIHKFLSAFNQTKYNILWKFDEELDPQKMPQNVRLTKWLPLSDVMAHPNVKIIIHHGGLLTCYEAIDREVPQIIFPLVYDEGANAKLLVERQVAIGMDLHDFDELSLAGAINQISKPIYKENVKNLRIRVHDQPMDRKELAVYHIESVIRYKAHFGRL